MMAKLGKRIKGQETPFLSQIASKAEWIWE